MKMPRRVDDRWFLPIEGLLSGLLTCLVPALHLGLAYAEREDAAGEAQQVIRCGGRAALELVDYAGDVCGCDINHRPATELRQQVLVEMPPRHGRMLEPSTDDLAPVPLLAELSK
jgi:hypothetical protein